MRRPDGRDRGSAVVEFALVVPLVMLVAGAAIQVIGLMHARGILNSAAAEGARSAALSAPQVRDRVASQTVRDFASRAVGAPAVDTIRTSRVSSGGAEFIRVRVSGRVSVMLLEHHVTLAAVGYGVVP